MIQIIPAILAKTKEEYEQKLLKVQESADFLGGWVQVDLMDGKFVGNKSLEPTEIEQVPTNFKYEFHLMVQEPVFYAEVLRKLRVERFIAHLEVGDEQLDQFWEAVIMMDRPADIGLAINPETPVEKLGNYLEMVDSVLVMSVNPGFSGQQFIPETIEKIKQLTSLRRQNKLNFLIEVDGGLNHQNIKSVVDAGADILVMGSALMEGDIDENLEQIWEILQG